MYVLGMGAGRIFKIGVAIHNQLKTSCSPTGKGKGEREVEGNGKGRVRGRVRGRGKRAEREGRRKGRQTNECTDLNKYSILLIFYINVNLAEPRVSICVIVYSLHFIPQHCYIYVYNWKNRLLTYELSYLFCPIQHSVKHVIHIAETRNAMCMLSSRTR